MALVTMTYIANRPLNVGDHIRQPGELVPEAAGWLPKVRDIHLDLGWLSVLKLVTAEDHAAYDHQLAAEESARAEARRRAPKVEPEPPKVEAPLPPARTLWCANCDGRLDFAEPPDDGAWFDCPHCYQHQNTDQAKRGMLQIDSSQPAVMRTAPQPEDLTADYMARIGMVT